MSAERPSAAGFWIRAAPRHVLSADALTCPHTRAHAIFLLESCFGFFGDKRDARVPEPTIFIAHDDRWSWNFECAAWSFVCRNIPPCRRMILFVRPVRWDSARVRFRREAQRNRCRRASCLSTKGRIAGTRWFRLGKRFASAFNRRNASSGNGPRCQDRTVSEMYSAQASITTLRRSKRSLRK